MSGTTTILKGVVRGRTIELDADPGLAEGATVDVTIQPERPTRLSIDEARAALDATAGACADEAEELDVFDANTRNLRHMDDRWID